MEKAFIAALPCSSEKGGMALPMLLGHITNTKGLRGRRAWHPSHWSDPEDEKMRRRVGAGSVSLGRGASVCVHMCWEAGEGPLTVVGSSEVFQQGIFALIPIPHPYPPHTHPFPPSSNNHRAVTPHISSSSSSSSLAHSKGSGMFHHELFSEWSTWEPSCRLQRALTYEQNYGLSPSLFDQKLSNASNLQC